jgi:hypothetical protein
VYVMNEADRRVATPERREEWDAVLNVNEQVPTTKSPQVCERSSYVLRVGAPGLDNPIWASAGRATAQQCNLVPAFLESNREAINDEFGAASLGMCEVPP